MLYSINGISQINLHEWSDIHYNDYNSNEFQKLEIIHSKIDIRNIDYKLFNAATDILQWPILRFKGAYISE